jgi:hypothetical protein
LAPPFQDQQCRIQHLIQVEERADDILFGDIVEIAEGKIDDLSQKNVKVPDGEFLKGFPEYRHRIPIFVFRKRSRPPLRYRFFSGHDCPFLCCQLQTIAGTHKRPERQVEIKEYGRIVFHQDFRLLGMLHHFIQPVFGRCRIVELEKGVHQAEGGMFTAAGPKF